MSAFYDQSYYESHYGRLLSDPNYYDLKSLFWRFNIFEKNRIPRDVKVLDFGCGLGQISAALPDVAYFDISEYAIEWLKSKGRVVFQIEDRIPEHHFDMVLSSHSLEHSLTPYKDLQKFRKYVNHGGHLLLVLPVETRYEKAYSEDNDRHMQTWTFQNLTNMLFASGWKPVLQRHIYDSFGLDRLGKHLSKDIAIKSSYYLGKHLFKNYKSMVVLSERMDCNNE